jgi:23S rRNA (guanosine2251-2'-O)-methyltransferase
MSPRDKDEQGRPEFKKKTQFSGAGQQRWSVPPPATGKSKAEGQSQTESKKRSDVYAHAKRAEAPAKADQSDKNENLVAGRKIVLEFLQHQAAQVDSVYILNEKINPEAQRVIDACRKENIRFALVPKQQLDKMYAGPHHGCVARLFEPGYWDEETLYEAGAAADFPVILAMDQIQDAGNVGALARTLFGLGGGGLLIPKHNAAYMGPGAVRASASALYRLPIARVTNLGRALTQAKERGYATYCATLDPASEDVFNITPRFPAIIALGNEEKGVRPGVAEHCEHAVHIPLAGKIDSLNVAQAGAMILSAFYAAARKRTTG